MRLATGYMNERGAGTALALGLIASITALTWVILGIGNSVVQQARVNALADTAALAAADALRGLVAGYPCDVARQIAPITRCEILGTDVLVEVSINGHSALARAGEPN
ncbi:MAG: hypothetical protein RL545_329 [Actinomycetota bacterium]